ncbi:MAG: anti-sigma factor, partial [Phycisphaerales bacterium]|nr:anti-sigma factor [Phycisphaerales bacterium]
SVVAWAAVLVLLVGGAIVATTMIRSRERALDVARAEVESLVARVDSNTRLLASVRADSDALNQQNLELAQRLAAATGDLQQAQDRIAMYETPVDPAELAARRTRLLEVPDVVQVAWAPFDLSEDNLAEQRDVRGDVVWSPSRKEGYLRFVGLRVNDPSVEQYQVWIIDERGMEQKVSGGVFNATSEGEVVVPIEPGIDVGRVQLFAVTIEEPGGIWVPDLSRRLTVAPVEQG